MNEFLELHQVINVILKRWWMVVAGTVIATAIGYGISQRQERVYQASTSVIVGQSIQATQLDTRDIQTSERLALTYADIVRRQPVLEGAIEALNLDESWLNLRRRVSVNIVENTQLLEISVEASSREEAVLIANELSRQLILLSPSALQDRGDEETSQFVRRRLEDLQTSIEGGQAKLDELTDAFVEARTPVERDEIQAEIDYLEGKIVDWENTYARFLAFVGNEESANYIAVVDQAYARLTPIRPNVRVNTLIAGTVGAVLALGIIFVLEFLDDTLKTVEDIRRDLNLTPLGMISQMGNADFRNQMIVAKDPFSPVSESYRMIRSNIQFMFIDRPGRSILITSPAPGEGKSSTAVNLGIALAQNGQRTIVVDTELRKPVLHKVFQVLNSDGLTDQLRWPEPAINVRLRETEVERLRLLPAGDIPPNPSELLGSQRMKQLVASLTNEADMVVFDSPPAAFVADAAIMAKLVDGVILVIAAGKTQREAARQAVFNLQTAGANILGVVLNRSEEKGGGYYYAPAAREQSLADDRVPGALQRSRRPRSTFAPATGGKRQVEGTAGLVDALNRFTKIFQTRRRPTYPEYEERPHIEEVPQADPEETDVAVQEPEYQEVSPEIPTLSQQPADNGKGITYLGSDQGGRFHSADCRYADKIPEDHRRCFSSRDVAIDSGYVPCKVCNP